MWLPRLWLTCLWLTLLWLTGLWLSRLRLSGWRLSRLGLASLHLTTLGLTGRILTCRQFSLGCRGSLCGGGLLQWIERLSDLFSTCSERIFSRFEVSLGLERLCICCGIRGLSCPLSCLGGRCLQLLFGRGGFSAGGPADHLCGLFEGFGSGRIIQPFFMTGRSGDVGRSCSNVLG